MPNSVLIKELCEVLVCKPVVLAFVLSMLFAAIGVVAVAGLNGRRRLWKGKADKDIVIQDFQDVKSMIAAIHVQMINIALGRKPTPPSDEIIQLANGGDNKTKKKGR